jgi:hypothetical protein
MSFVDWYSQYCENDHSAESNLQSQWTVDQNWNQKSQSENSYGRTKDPKIAKATLRKRTMLEVPKYLTLNYIK